MKSLPLIHLFGDIQENFYQLGLRDKEKAKLVHSDVKNLLKTPYPLVNKLLEEVGKTIIKNTALKKSGFETILQPYAEGLSIPLEELIYINSIPEIVSGMSQWAPGLKLSTLGCTSVFLRNSKNNPVHFRVLDFPLTESYQDNERMILYDFKEFPKTLAFNAVGIPFPSITLMNESFTLALHQKFTDVFIPKNESIFEIIFELLKEVTDKKSAIEFLQKKKSMTTWSIYMSFKNGDVLAYDIMGDSFYFKEYHLADSPLCFHNELINEDINQDKFLPFGFSEFNRLRKIVSNEKIQRLNKNKMNDNLNILKILSTPEHHLDSPNKGIDFITPTSITVQLMDINDAEVLYNSGKIPRIFHSPIAIRQCFNDCITESIKIKESKKVENYYFSLQSLMKAQHGFDDKNSQVVYHELQMAYDHLENGNLKSITKFYFLVAQYLYEHHSKAQKQLLLDFKENKENLPPYLHDQALLFITRLEKILNRPVTIEIDEIKNENLKKIYKLELSMPRTLFHFTHKQFIIPRIDILDVIYVYSH